MPALAPLISPSLISPPVNPIALAAGATGPSFEGTTAGLPAPQNVGVPVPPSLAPIYKRESGFNFQAQNPTSTASGAGQDIDSTFREAMHALGYGGQWAHAKDAPPEIQNAANIWLQGKYGNKPWAASEPGNIAYHQQKADIHAKSDALAGQMQDLNTKIGSLDARDPESRKELAHYREQMEKYQQEALQLSTHPPQYNPRDEMQRMGSLATLVGMLGGLFTKTPMIASLNAGAAAMNAMKQQDNDEYKRHMEVWKTATDALFKMAGFEHDMYRDTLQDEKLSTSEKLDKIRAQASLMQNQQMILNAQSGDLDRIEADRRNYDKLLTTANKPQLYVGQDGKPFEYHPLEHTITEIKGPEGGISKIGTGAQGAPNPQTVDSTAKMISEYKMAPMSGWALRSPFGQQVMAKVSQLNPEYDATRYAAKLRAEVAFTSGRQGDAVRSFSVSIDHLNIAEELGDALANKDEPALNRLKNAVKTQLGYEGPIDFNFAKAVVGDEVSKAVIGGVGSQTDRQQLQDGFSAANSPEQLAGVIHTAKRLMAGQLSGYRRQAGTAGFSEDQFEQALSPAAKKELEGLGGTPGGAPAAKGKLPSDLPPSTGHAEGSVAKDDSGRVVAKIRNGQWVEP